MKSLKLTIHISLGFTKTQQAGEQIPVFFCKKILTELRTVQNVANCASFITQKILYVVSFGKQYHLQYSLLCLQ